MSTTTVNIHPQHRIAEKYKNGIMRTAIHIYTRADGSQWHSVDIYMSDENDNGQSTMVTFFPEMTNEQLDKAYPQAIWHNPVAI